MSSSPSHYDVQKRRRDDFLDGWRLNRKPVVSPEDAVEVQSATPAAGQRSWAYLGTAAGRPTRFLDATRHTFSAGSSTEPASTTWDAVCFVTSGSGSLTVDGSRVDFRAWDAFHLPAFSTYSCAFTSDTELLSFSSFPAVSLLQAARILDPGRSPEEAGGAGRGGAFALAEMQDEARAAVDEARKARVHTDYDAETLRLNPKGTRSKFLVDPSLGYRTSGLTMVMTQYAPGRGQAMHAHPGEAYLYVVEGEGETYIGDDPDSGTWHPWQAGDFVVVDHFVWHQHRNRSTERPARLLRVHMMETMLETMRAVLDPIELLLEPAELFAKIPDASGAHWPDDRRPG